MDRSYATKRSPKPFSLQLRKELWYADQRKSGTSGRCTPSDDDRAYNYNVPDNMFATVALDKAAELADQVFRNSALAVPGSLSLSVEKAIQQYGISGNSAVPRMLHLKSMALKSIAP